jgi:hypothetical protein
MGQEVTPERKPGANGFHSPNRHGIFSHSKTGAAIGCPADDADLLRMCRQRRLGGRWGAEPGRIGGGGSGEILLQVVNYNTGFLVNTPEGVAHRTRCLLLHKDRT